jgi:hypothetical protein
MLAFISRLVMQLAAIRWLFKLGGLALLLPLAGLLKVIGIPLLLILFVLGLPIFILLFLFGLPIFAVMILGSLAVGLMGMVLTIGVAAIKFALFVVLPIWLMWKVSKWIFKGLFGRRGGDDSTPTTTEPVDPIDLGTPPDLGTDPAV